MDGPRGGPTASDSWWFGGRCVSAPGGLEANLVVGGLEEQLLRWRTSVHLGMAPLWHLGSGYGVYALIG